MKAKTRVDCHIPSKRLEIGVDFTPDEISRVLREIEMKTEMVATIVETRIKIIIFQQGISRQAGILLTPTILSTKYRETFTNQSLFL